MAISTNLIKSFQLSALTTALALAGCGGGGGNDTLPPPVKGGGTTDSTGSTPTSAINISAISLEGVNSASFIPSTGATAKVKVTDAAGKGISGAIVAFSASGGVSFSTTNSSVLTDTEGNASIFVKPIDINDNGTYTLTATSTYNSITATSKPYAFSLQKTNLKITQLKTEVPTNTTLEVGGSTNVSLIVTDENGVVQPNTTVNFTNNCGTFTEDSVMTNSEGVATTTYSAIKADGSLCTDTSVIITVSTTTGVSANTSINLTPIVGNSIAYTTTGAVNLGASNSGSSTSGQIEFTVYSNGKPAANQDVIINKTYAPLDFSFVKLGNQSAQTVKSDSNGKVNVTLYPGALPGPVELKATLATNSTITALSKDVAVATGRATQNGMSVSLLKNTLAVGVDGDTTEVTVRLVDRVGNAVPDGTVVSFVSEGGKITPNCSTVDGVCSATFTTQNPRSDGRLSVIAYVEGDKSYIDSNGNNKFDIGEPLSHNIGSFYRDDNENGAHDLGEYVYIRPITGSPLACGTSSFGEPNLVTQILSVNPLSTVTHQCDDQLETVLRYQFILGLAGNVPVYDDNSPTDSTPENLTYTLPVNTINTPIKYNFDMFGNSARTVSMPAGTTISVSAVDKTTYNPEIIETTTGSTRTFSVSKAEPNNTVTVKVGNFAPNTVIADKLGNANITTNIPKENTETPSIVDTNVTCKAEFTAGVLTVPNIMNLSLANGKIIDPRVNYTITYEDCRAGDQIKVTTNAPSPAANTLTRTIYVQ
ncbi:hypothetical protein CYJ96_00345 [Moraxella osloensis]|uniref:Big-1 domain-containing protein n=1 Tax=Faucicola osloensis TaxID=34062 RepID=A0A2I1RL41_FAUOS|nr:hypothetical protein [Moraxella osloensis]PKZ69842.1 hypothetical protein CYJ96_00345 [Moraxella osloensis]